MSVRIASNISSLTSQRRLNEATRDLANVSEKLSSGLRISRFGDDAAGLQIAEGLKGDSRVYGQAIRNVNDGLSLLNIVTRQAELTEQAANGNYSYKQRIVDNPSQDIDSTALLGSYDMNYTLSSNSCSGSSPL